MRHVLDAILEDALAQVDLFQPCCDNFCNLDIEYRALLCSEMEHPCPAS